MRNPFLKLSQGIKESDNYVSLQEYFRMKYLIRLLKDANLGTINHFTAKQFGMFHKTVWVEDDTMVQKFSSMHKDALQSWVFHHYLKAICRSLAVLEDTDNVYHFQLLTVTPEEHDAIARTVKIFKDKVLGGYGETNYQRNLVLLKNDLALRQEIESSVAMLQGILPQQHAHGKSSVTSKMQAHDMRIHPNLFDSISVIRESIDMDRDYDYTLNVADKNDVLKWYGTILDFYLSMVRFNTYEWDDRNKYPTLDDEYRRYLVEDNYSYSRAIESVRPYTSGSEVTPEIAILLYKAPICTCRENIRPNRYGGTDIEKYVVCDFMVRQRIFDKESENEESGVISESSSSRAAEPLPY